MKKIVYAAGVAVLMQATVASAGLIVGQEQFNAGDVLPSTITAVSGDLLETSVSAVAGENAAANVRDGLTGTAHSTPVALWRQGGDLLTYTLDTTGANATGYDIAEIRVFTGWKDGRTTQDYEIWYSVVGSADFVQLGAAVSTTGSNGSTMTRTYDDAGAAILTGVDAIQFNITDQESAYREIDVIAIPEPATLGLVAAFGGGVLFIRRRFMI